MSCAAGHPLAVLRESTTRASGSAEATFNGVPDDRAVG